MARTMSAAPYFCRFGPLFLARYNPAILITKALSILRQSLQLRYRVAELNSVRTRHLNAGDRAAAFMGWLKPVAIRQRREAERDLFATGRYRAGTIPVWSVDRNGKVDFSRPIRRLTEDEALALLRPESAPVPRQSVVAPSWWRRLLDHFKGKATS